MGSDLGTGTAPDGLCELDNSMGYPTVHCAHGIDPEAVARTVAWHQLGRDIVTSGGTSGGGTRHRYWHRMPEYVAGVLTRCGVSCEEWRTYTADGIALSGVKVEGTFYAITA